MQMWEWAWRFFADHPVRGIGAGSYRQAVRESPEYRAAVEEHAGSGRKIARDHPHSTYLYALACLGMIGGAILLAWMLIVVHRCWSDPPDHVYADGTLAALVTWLIGAQFDCYNLNGEEFGLLGLIISVTLHARPRARLNLAADDDLNDYLAAISPAAASASAPAPEQGHSPLYREYDTRS
jgi:hypothetical protein